VLNVDLSIRAADGQGVVALCGDFDPADAPAVTSHLIAAIAACGPLAIVDLAALESIGFAGLEVLLRIRRWSRNGGGDLPLAAPRLPVRHVLEAIGLSDVFSIYRSVDEAVRGAHPPSRCTSVVRALIGN
jgi:anti-sigma B factor antagonist